MEITLMNPDVDKLTKLTKTKNLEIIIAFVLIRSHVMVLEI